MIDVLFVSYSDWANVGASLAHACKAVGMDALSVSKAPLKLAYPLESDRWRTGKHLQALVAGADVIVFMHSFLPENLKFDRGNRFMVFHGGSAYRRCPRMRARAFNRVCEKTFIQTKDLMGFGSVNETWLIPPVDEDFIQPSYRTVESMRNNYIVAHYPRATGQGWHKKGGPVVQRIMVQFSKRCEFRSSQKTVKWTEQLRRVSECDIYIERLGAKIKEWGVSALEAAALGKVVITTFAGKDAYEKVFGSCPMIVANSQAELSQQVDRLLKSEPEEMRKLQEEHREWITKTHGMEPTGAYLKRALQL